MNLPSFSRYVTASGWPTDEAQSLFRSADIYQRNAISFREFIYFLAAVEPGAATGGPTAELRCRYIFRYLDMDKNNLLKRDELKQYVMIVRRCRRQSLDNPKVDKELTDLYKYVTCQNRCHICVK